MYWKSREINDEHNRSETPIHIILSRENESYMENSPYYLTQSKSHRSKGPKNIMHDRQEGLDSYSNLLVDDASHERLRLHQLTKGLKQALELVRYMTDAFQAKQMQSNDDGT